MGPGLRPGHIITGMTLNAEFLSESRYNGSVISYASKPELIYIGVNVGWPVPEKIDVIWRVASNPKAL